MYKYQIVYSLLYKGSINQNCVIIEALNEEQARDIFNNQSLLDYKRGKTSKPYNIIYVTNISKKERMYRRSGVMRILIITILLLNVSLAREGSTRTMIDHVKESLVFKNVSPDPDKKIVCSVSYCGTIEDLSKRGMKPLSAQDRHELTAIVKSFN